MNFQLVDRIKGWDVNQNLQVKCDKDQLVTVYNNEGKFIQHLPILIYAAASLSTSDMYYLLQG
jgi:hypothetical protein